MDLLASLGLADALPEQSSRLDHPGIVKSLNLTEEDVRLGFNRCLHCGDKFDDAGGAPRKTRKGSSDDGGRLNKPVTCKGCKRVKYCSLACRASDAQACQRDEATGCAGHSPVICSLLSLCDDDEAAEEEFYVDGGNDDEFASKKKASGSSADDTKRDAARYRAQTERESYPATLFNLLAESPNWFVEALTRRLRHMEDPRSPQAETSEPKKRRGKRDRTPPPESPAKLHWEGRRKRELVLHIVGASADSELWGWNGRERQDGAKGQDEFPGVLNAYAEASTNLLSFLKDLLEIRECSIRLIFVGPDCPKSKTARAAVEVPIPDSRGSFLVVEKHRCDYGSDEQPCLSPPDAIIFFNPGFSCTDYDWSKALSSACAYQLSSDMMGCPTPFIITTNTEMEGFADVKCLLDGGYVDPKSLPREVLEAVDCSATGYDESSATFIFGQNPYSGFRVRQSGTMGNDLFVKNRWIIGGLFRKCDGRVVDDGAAPSKKRKNNSEGENKTYDADDIDDDEHEKTSRKKHRSGGRGVRSSSGGKSKKNKRKNPALI